MVAASIRAQLPRKPQRRQKLGFPLAIRGFVRYTVPEQRVSALCSARYPAAVVLRGFAAGYHFIFTALPGIPGLCPPPRNFWRLEYVAARRRVLLNRRWRIYSNRWPIPDEIRSSWEKLSRAVVQAARSRLRGEISNIFSGEVTPVESASRSSPFRTKPLPLRPEHG